jgi:hypothetical protein
MYILYVTYVLLLLVLAYYSYNSTLYKDRLYTRITLLAYTMFALALII